MHEPGCWRRPQGTKNCTKKLSILSTLLHALWLQVEINGVRQPELFTGASISHNRYLHSALHYGTLAVLSLTLSYPRSMHASHSCCTDVQARELLCAGFALCAGAWA